MAAQDITVFLKKNIKFSMTGVSSETLESVTLDVQRTYRDGMSLATISVDPSIAHIGAASAYSVPPAAPITSAGQALYIPPFINTDEYTHTAPRHEQVKRSRYIWKNAGGDTIGWAWCDQIVSISTGTPSRI